MDSLSENTRLRKLLQGQPRSPHQTHGVFESDMEILRVGRGRWLGLSTDSIADEISGGLYRDPETWAWMCVMSSVSDLAASGMIPRGLLLSCQWGKTVTEAQRRRFFQSAKRALRLTKVPLLGGDSGSAASSVFTSTILGEDDRPPLTRLGARSGDLLVLMGRRALGAGPALSARFLMNLPSRVWPEKNFRPRPQPSLVRQWRTQARAAIDTSDGLMVASHILAVLNGLGLELHWREDSLLPQAAAFADRHGLPRPWLWLNDLGDLQTLLVFPARMESRLKQQRDLLVIGRFQKQKGLFLTDKGLRKEIPVEFLNADLRDPRSLRRHFQKSRRLFL